MSSIKLKHSGGNSVIIAGPSSNPAADRTINLNDNYAGDGSFVTANSSGEVGIADTIFHTGDTNTKIRFPEADNVTVECAGNERFRVKPTNDVALFTGSNSATLTIRNDTSNEMQIHTGSSDALIFGTDGENERVRINSDGDVLIGTTTINPGVGSNYQTPGTMIRASSGDYIAVSRAQGCPLFLNRDDSTGHLISLRYNATERGSIATDGTNVAYNTSSDYRLKENVISLTGAIDRLKTLSPKRFNFKEIPSKTVDGFLAHEVTAVPEAITGTKDEVATEDDEGRGIKKGDPIYQGIDQSKLVPLLTAALQEAIAKIETLETKVAALEAG